MNLSNQPQRILEGVVTTTGADGRTNISPMGPLVDDFMNELVFRPFQTSATYENLKRTGEGVFHVTDDVELIARAAVGRLAAEPPLVPAEVIRGHRLRGACRWYEFRVLHIDDSQPRSTMGAEVVARGRERDFFGFNRAMHAVVEAAILATRIELLPAEEILADFARLGVAVEKTGGPRERRAFDFLTHFVHERLATPRRAS